MLNNMNFNKAYTCQKTNSHLDNKKILDDFKRKFEKYRDEWSKQPERVIKNKILPEELINQNIRPLCVDIEVASICDLACSFCFREHEVTPDKIIDEKFCYKLIDQTAELKIPSIKFNWRGEPLLHPKLPKFVNYAKKKGILETIINTNATTLTEEKSQDLIEAGLDFIIYSFDGGSKKTYEKMRPGRFKINKFENVYNNIKNFNKIRNKLKSPFPYTKIQMILTNDTINEVDNFFSLFQNYVDDVSLNQYTERGGDLKSLNCKELKSYKKKIQDKKLPEDTPYLKEINGEIKISTGRIPCKQPFQRLMVTYEGKVAMCCYDWGAKHPIGYTNSKSFNNDEDYLSIFNKVKKKEKGFELLDKVVMPKKFNSPKRNVQTIKEIWFGQEINKVRQDHINCNGTNTEICKNCTFKDVYNWE